LTPKRHHISELCIEYRFGETLDKTISERVLSTYHYLLETLDFKTLAICDMIPTYTTIAIHFSHMSPLFHTPEYLDGIIIENSEESFTCKHSKTFEIDVDYRGEDMAYLCQTLQLSKEAFIALHANRPYTIAMLGFRPYFPYLLGLDERLHLPRRDTPRLHVRKGAVAIGMAQTGIYSEDSPGGWHIIGHTTFDDFEKLRPSDIIIFRALKERDVD
ncbi:MAG: carboxyltransferase domain-containing protein, partial [Campylobacterota bacterium]|nr:carboxyltransferase domain-containing protein [Campylobacterota bacterium]